MQRLKPEHLITGLKESSGYCGIADLDELILFTSSLKLASIYKQVKVSLGFEMDAMPGKNMCGLSSMATFCSLLSCNIATLGTVLTICWLVHRKPFDTDVYWTEHKTLHWHSRVMDQLFWHPRRSHNFHRPSP